MPILQKYVLRLLAIAFVLLAIAAAALTLGGPRAIPPMQEISQPFKGLNWEALPANSFFNARDGQRLAFRSYAPEGLKPSGSVILIHGSSDNGTGMHHLALALSRQGKQVFVPSMRGHGESLIPIPRSGTLRLGDANYVGQLDDDLEDLLKHLAANNQVLKPLTLVGFSSGGGFALRVTASPLAKQFDQAILLAPFLSHRAPTYKPNSGGWASVGVPRMAALFTLNAFGLQHFNHLPVIRFAIAQGNPSKLTESYSFNLQQNFGPPWDYESAIQGLAIPTTVLVGANDESFHADQFAPLLARLNPAMKVSVIPDLGHIPLVLDARGHNAVVNALQTNKP